MKRILLACLLLLTGAGEVAAQSYSELAPQGYILFRRTHVVGVFEGCQKDLDVQFAEDTIFTCLGDGHHMAFQPPVVILRNGETNSYAVIIDGKAYKGFIGQFEGKRLSRPLKADDVQGGPTKPILGADAIPLPGVPYYALTPDAVKPKTLTPNIPLAPGTQGTPIDPLLKLNQNNPPR